MCYNINSKLLNSKGGFIMTHYCTVPVPRKDGKILDEHGNYFTCGLKAKYKVGIWYVCEKHKTYYTDQNGWKAIPLEEYNELNKKEISSN